MDYLTYKSRLDYLQEMIEKERLNSLENASQLFGCSKRTIKRMLSRLRDQGFDCYYCRKTRKFIKTS